MMPARPLPEDEPQTADVLAPPAMMPPQRAAAGWVFTPDGRLVTGGTVALREDGEDWAALLTKLDRPGMVASLYFAEGLREVALTLQDGRSARARIASTTFLASAERVCELTGLEPLA